MFERENPGFDTIVGNPPFLGGKRISTVHGRRFRDWLVTLNTASNNNADLVAHFFRRTFDLLRQQGVLGLIATNTIGQGDTRSAGLRWICKNGGTIYRARRRTLWPGEASVVVSVIHVINGLTTTLSDLDGHKVETITAFLFHRGDHNDPEKIEANAGKSFVGNYILGMGFTFDDTDKEGVATPIVEMQRLVNENPLNREIVMPYVGGEEVNASPIHAHHRYVINFGDMPLRRDSLGELWRDADKQQRSQWFRTGIVPVDYPESVAADWASLLSIVEERVRPERVRKKRKSLRERWWQFAEKQPALHAAILNLSRVLLTPQTSNVQALTFLPSNMIYGHTLIVFALTGYDSFCCLQSRVHQVWSAFLGPTMKDDLRYTPSDCFETFPFPEVWETHPILEEAGEAYYEFRAALMVENDEGMTKTYNRFHDPDERDTRIAELRELHAAMDRAVLDAYGWRDIPTDCEFLLDYEIDEETWGRKKKPYRYRWPDAVRDEVLARLLALNAERAREERLARLRKSG